MNGQPILAIDGGGSKTLIATADATGNLTAIASGGGINPMDNPPWREDLASLFRRFEADPTVLAGAVAALPAYGEVATVSRAQEDAVATLLGPVPHRILNDVDAAHFGAFAGSAGILILSGTGSMAWARDVRGKSFRVGGWGEVIGDEGSSHWIGMRALGLASQSLDGRADATGLVDALFAFVGLDRSNAQDSLTGWVTRLGHARSEIAAIAPLVDRLAGDGEPGALAIVDEAASHLARHIEAIAKQVDSSQQLPWSYAGGTFKGRMLLDTLIRKIDRPPRPPILPPIGGALLCAAIDLNWPVDEAWIGQLAASIENNAIATRGEARTNVNQGEQGHAREAS